MTARDKTPFPFRAFQVDRSWYKRYWESDPPAPRRQVFVGAMFLILLAVSMVIPIAAEKGVLPMEKQTVERESPSRF